MDRPPSSQVAGEAGAHLVFFGPDLAIAQAAMAALHIKGFWAVAGEVRDAARRTACLDDLTKCGAPATNFVNNAGVGKNGIEAQDMTDGDWLWMMDVNLNAVF